MCTNFVYASFVNIATIIESSNANTDDTQKTNKDDEKPESGPSEANSAAK